MSTNLILVTGSSGLIGSSIVQSFRSLGISISPIDLKAENKLEFVDIRDAARIRQLIQKCDGIIHLAAISRVAEAERDPAICHTTNIIGLRNVIDAALSASNPPWLIFASSREVYGQPETLPVDEGHPCQPISVYGQSKAEGERLVEVARKSGLNAISVRLANVYGSETDHPERVIPSFIRAATIGRPLQIHGSKRVFDFTHVDDVTSGILAIVRLMQARECLPPQLQLVSGIPVTLGELANSIIKLSGSRSSVLTAEYKDFEVSNFVGDGTRAKALLGWSPTVSLEVGLSQLIQEFRENLTFIQPAVRIA